MSKVQYDPFSAEVMEDPGANRSTHVPKLEYDARASVLVVAPTVRAAGSAAGEERQASALLFPAATANTTPALTAFATAWFKAELNPPPRDMSNH